MLFCLCSSGHPWVCESGVAPDKALDPGVLSRLKQFSAMNKLKKMALRVCILHGKDSFTFDKSSGIYGCLRGMCSRFLLPITRVSFLVKLEMKRPVS